MAARGSLTKSTPLNNGTSYIECSTTCCVVSVHCPLGIFSTTVCVSPPSSSHTRRLKERCTALSSQQNVKTTTTWIMKIQLPKMEYHMLRSSPTIPESFRTTFRLLLKDIILLSPLCSSIRYNIYALHLSG